MTARQADLEMDLQNLLSCIECHAEEKKVDVIIETLKTVITICSEEDCGKDAFRDVGGLDFLLDFIAGTDQLIILEYGLKVLAFILDENVHNQMHLTDSKIFTILQVIFEKNTYPLVIVKNAAVLFSTILFQNKTAQELIREEGFLQCMINQYKQYVPRSTLYSNPPAEDSECLEIWLNINSALCFAVNNPLNERNQAECSCLFPLTLTTLDTPNLVIIDASSSFLSLTIVNNGRNQDRFNEYDGFLILKRCLKRNFELMLSDIKECNNVISKGIIQAISCLIDIISAAVIDNEKNSALCGQLGIVSLMIEFLSIDILDSCIKKKAILVLGQCIDAFCDNKSFILDVPEFDLLLKKNLETDDSELCYATKYLLQVCLNGCKEELKANNHSVTAVSNQKSSNDQLCDRVKDDAHQQMKKATKTKVTSKCHDCENFQPNVHGGRNKFLNLPLKNYPLSFEEKIDLLNSISDKELKFHKIKNPDLNTSNLCKNYSDFDADVMPDQRKQGKNQHIPKHKKDCLGTNKSSECDSLDEISLQSACHFYNMMMLQKASRESKCFKDIYDTTNSKCTALPNKKRKCDLNASKLSGCSKIKKTNCCHKQPRLNVSKASQSKNYSNCSCLCKVENGDKTICKNCSNVSNFKLAPNSSSEQKNKLTNIPVDCLSLRHNSSLNNKHISKENIKPKSGKNSHPSFVQALFHGHRPINVCSGLNFSNVNKSNPTLELDKHRVTKSEANNIGYSDKRYLNMTNSNQTLEFSDRCTAAKVEANSIRGWSDKRDISKLCSINLEPLSKFCLKDETKSGLIRNSKMSQKDKGCVQVIVLPGPSCPLHKIASQFEMLKVCPLRNVTNTA